MKISFEQLFYGRGERGYGMLGVSPGGRAFAPRVESLCGAVGTPGSDYGGEPFLLSAPEGEHVIMLCGRRGAPDSMGRSTLFFQALVASKAEMARVKADVFSLFLHGAFADKMQTGDIGALTIDVKADRVSAPISRLDVSLPCVFRSEKPLPDSVCATVGERANDLSWATFSFQPLSGFDVQVLPLRVLCSQTVNEYDASGRLGRSAAAVNTPRAEEKLDGGRERGTPSSYSSFPKESLPERSNAMLKFSIVANLVLLVVCAVLLVSRKSMPDSSASTTEQIVVTNFVEKVVEKQVEAQLSDAQKAEIENAAIARFRSELTNRFPKGKEINDFDERIKELPKYEDISKDSKFNQQKAFLDKLNAYVDFVNKNLLKGKNP